MQWTKKTGNQRLASRCKALPSRVLAGVVGVAGAAALQRQRQWDLSRRCQRQVRRQGSCGVHMRRLWVRFTAPQAAHRQAMGAAESPGLPEHGGVQPQRLGSQGASAGRAAGGAAPRGQGLANARRGRHLLSNLCFQTNSCWRRLRKGWRLIWLVFPGSEATKRSEATKPPNKDTKNGQPLGCHWHPSGTGLPCMCSQSPVHPNGARPACTATSWQETGCASGGAGAPARVHSAADGVLLELFDFALQPGGHLGVQGVVRGQPYAFVLQ